MSRPLFQVGENVVCIDASDLPSPPWSPLKCGAVYTIRSVEPIPEVDGNYDKNIHKRAGYLVRVWGVSNPYHPIFKKELAYAETRFERADDSLGEINAEELAEVAA